MPGVKFVDLGLQYTALRTEILAKFDEISLGGAYVLSEEVAAFERNFAAYCGSRFAIGVANGSDALYLSLLSMGVGPGDEVITVPNSFVATAWVIARTGARIVFCDVDEGMNMNPDLLGALITPRTRAIMPVHLTGRVADMDRITPLAQRNGVPVIEDAAQAVGAVYRGRKAGAFGVCAGFSLHPLKNLHVHGDGGVITTDDQGLYEKLLKYRNHGLKSRDECEFWGINSRLDAVHAGIANLKLSYLDRWNARHREIARTYGEHLREWVETPSEHPHEQPIYHRYMIRHPDRDGLQRHLEAQGIETRVNYPIPLHLQPAAASLGYKRGDFPVAEELARTILSLPVYAELPMDHVHCVIEHVIEYCRKHPCWGQRSEKVRSR
jgi:dTDP-4-amino-4,6-dideoxygalactose transaminase